MTVSPRGLTLWILRKPCASGTWKAMTRKGTTAAWMNTSNTSQSSSFRLAYDYPLVSIRYGERPEVRAKLTQARKR